jgi:hypothetical protein
MQLNLADEPIGVATCRYRKPFRALVSLDFVAVTPVVFGVLEVVIENEQIDIVNDIEITLPGNVI